MDDNSRREKIKEKRLSRFLDNFPTKHDTTVSELYPSRRVFWSERNNNDDDDAWIKIKSAFSSVVTTRLDGLIQFWAPTPHLLSTSDQPFVLEDYNPNSLKYRLSCLNHHYTIHHDENDDSIISNALVPDAFINHFPDVVMDLNIYKGSPLVDIALHCGFTCAILLPVFSQTSVCVGVVECCIKFSSLLVLFRHLKLALERSGLNTYNPKHCLPYELTTTGLKHAKGEIEAALPFICESHNLTFGQVWITNKSVNNVAISSLSSSQSKRGMYLVKLCGYCVNSDDDDDIKSYKNCEMLPLKNGEGLAWKTFETKEPRFSKNPCKLKSKGILGLLSSCSKYSCFTICLSSTHTNEFHYVFEFFWSRSRNHFTLLKSLMLALQTRLPSFLYPSGAKLDDQNPNLSLSMLLRILEKNKSSQIPQHELQEELHGPKLLKRKISEDEDEPIYVSDSGSYWRYDDDIFILADCGGKKTLVTLRSSYTLSYVKDRVEEVFCLDPEKYTMEFDFEGEKGVLNTDENLVSCIKTWKSIQMKSDRNIQFEVHVQPSVTP